MSETKAAVVHTFEQHSLPHKTAEYHTALGYLRTFLVILVVAHHSVLAYHSFAPAPPASLTAQPRWWAAFPVVDTQRWTGFTLFAGFNDVFFMSLLFFLSGIFVWSSVQRKGAKTFLRDRLIRLGLPFGIAAAVIAPLAYFPTYLQTGAAPNLSGFWQQWIALGQWPSGPVWFVWVLLVFDCVAVMLISGLARSGSSPDRLLSCALNRPLILFATLVSVSAAVYVPMALMFNPMHWSAFGPFALQTSRILHYLAYFLIGLAIGAYGIERSLVATNGMLARRWPLWMLSALVAFALATLVTIVMLTSHAGSTGWAAMAAHGFVVSCATFAFAFLAVFVRFAKSRFKLYDSLCENSYGIYLIHYAFVSWLQYALIKDQLPAIAKAAIVFSGSLLLSWVAISMLRRIPAVRRVI